MITPHIITCGEIVTRNHRHEQSGGIICSVTVTQTVNIVGQGHHRVRPVPAINGPQHCPFRPPGDESPFAKISIEPASLQSRMSPSQSHCWNSKWCRLIPRPQKRRSRMRPHAKYSLSAMGCADATLAANPLARIRTRTTGRQRGPTSVAS